MKRISAGAAVLCLSLCGCLNNRYIVPVTAFQTTTAQTVHVLSDFYASRNAYELQLYLSNVASDPSLKVLTVDANGVPTPLGAPVFAPGSLKARLDALSLVGAYASRLYDLANTSAPADFETAATALGTNLSSLGATFQTLGAKDATATAYVGPVTTLVGIIGKMYLAGKRDALVRQAIQDGGPVVDTILVQIRDDMDKVFALEISTGTNQTLAQLIGDYNTQRASLSHDERVAKLAQIAAASEAASSTSAPSQLVASMQDANNALLKAAQASKSDKQLSLASLNDALSAWSAEVQTLATEIKPLIK
jgi:hypothetical protein